MKPEMKKSAFTEFAKFIIDSSLKPLGRNKILLSHIINHTFRQEFEENIEQGGLFPMFHIHRSIKLAKMLNFQDFIILDVGGGIGASVVLYKEHYPENKLIVFEPIRNNFDTIKSRTKKLKNIEVINKAAGNENSATTINIANRITSSSILPLSADRKSNVFNENTLGQNHSEEIEVIRLDDFMSTYPGDIGIMKIDVQGYELNVLSGAEKTLDRTSIIVMEANNHEGYSGAPKYFETDLFLREHNFILYDILPSIFEKGKLKEWDVIYLNNKEECTLG